MDGRIPDGEVGGDDGGEEDDDGRGGMRERRRTMKRGGGKGGQENESTAIDDDVGVESFKSSRRLNWPRGVKSQGPSKKQLQSPPILTKWPDTRGMLSRLWRCERKL